LKNQHHEKARQFKNTEYPLYDNLAELFDKGCPDGRHSQSSCDQQIRQQNLIADVENQKSQFPSEGSHIIDTIEEEQRGSIDPPERNDKEISNLPQDTFSKASSITPFIIPDVLESLKSPLKANNNSQNLPNLKSKGKKRPISELADAINQYAAIKRETTASRYTKAMAILKDEFDFSDEEKALAYELLRDDKTVDMFINMDADSSRKIWFTRMVNSIKEKETLWI